MMHMRVEYGVTIVTIGGEGEMVNVGDSQEPQKLVVR